MFLCLPHCSQDPVSSQKKRNYDDSDSNSEDSPRQPAVSSTVKRSNRYVVCSFKLSQLVKDLKKELEQLQDLLTKQETGAGQ